MGTGYVREDRKEASNLTNRAIPAPGRVIHMNSLLPDGRKTPCRPAIVTGLDGDTIFVTQFAPNLQPAQLVVKRDSARWHWPGTEDD